MSSLRDVILTLDATAQAALVRKKDVSARELIEAAIGNVERFNPAINAVTVKNYDGVLSDADRIDLRGADAPFAAVPFLLKDLGPTCAGLEACLGSAFLAGFVPQRDAELITRFRRAGLLFLGKSNTAEFGALPTTEPAFLGATRNPWALDRSAGGSSGGAAAAVAAGLVPVAHGNDAGGSIRIPASCCGVFGLKPTRARVSLGPDVGDLMNGLVCEFVLSRSVRDSAALLDAVAGPVPGDPYYAPPAPRSFTEALTPSQRCLRIAVAPAAAEDDPSCSDATRRAARLCSELGHRVEEVSLPAKFAELRELFVAVWAAGVSSAITSYAQLSGREPRPEHFEEFTFWLYEQGQRISASRYLVAIGHLQRAARKLAAFYEHYDIYLSSVTSQPAPPIGYFASGTVEQQLERALTFVADTPLANLTGQPAMSVPVYRCGNGLPVGAHFTARVGDEASLLGLAAQLEMACPWSAHLPATTSAAPPLN
ncbi:MAG: amidase family protein [Polyangiaceae bacterium]